MEERRGLEWLFFLPPFSLMSSSQALGVNCGMSRDVNWGRYREEKNCLGITCQVRFFSFFLGWNYQSDRLRLCIIYSRIQSSQIKPAALPHFSAQKRDFFLSHLSWEPKFDVAISSFYTSRRKTTREQIWPLTPSHFFKPSVSWDQNKWTMGKEK